MTVQGVCDFCAKDAQLIFSWWACGINICASCDRERQKTALSRVLPPEKELKP